MKLWHFVGDDSWMLACLKVCGKRWFIMRILCGIYLIYTIFSKLDPFLSIYRRRRAPTLLLPSERNSFHQQTGIQWWFYALHIMTTEPVSEILCLLNESQTWTIFNIICLFYVFLRSLPLILSMIAFWCQHWRWSHRISSWR